MSCVISLIRAVIAASKSRWLVFFLWGKSNPGHSLPQYDAGFGIDQLKVHYRVGMAGCLAKAWRVGDRRTENDVRVGGELTS
jgi:hypothetical protein